MKQIKTTSCGTATIRKGESGYEVLLVQPRADQNVWGFPKGHTEEGEEHEDTAARETREETGVDVVLLPCLLGEARVNLKYEDKTVIIYVAEPTDPSGEPEARDGENHDVRYWPVEDLPSFHKYQQGLAESLPNVVRKLFKE